MRLLLGDGEEGLSHNLKGPVSDLLQQLDEVMIFTYRPDASNRRHYTTGDSHGPQTLRTPEQHAAQRAGGNCVGSIVLAAHISNIRVKAVVDNSNNTS